MRKGGVENERLRLFELEEDQALTEDDACILCMRRVCPRPCRRSDYHGSSWLRQ